MRRTILLSIGILTVTFGALAQIQPAGPSEGDIRIEKIELADVAVDRVHLAVYPEIVPYVDAKIDGIRFYSMRLNGMPIFIPEVSEPLNLRAGQRIRLRRPLEVTIFFRDLSSLQSVIDLIRNSQVRLEGTAIFEARLSLLPALVLRTRTARAPMRFQVDVPVTLPVSRLTREAAQRILQLAEPGSRTLRGKIVTLIDSTESRRRLMQDFGNTLLFAVARYTLADANGKKYPMESSGIAFRIEPKRYILLRELAEPWHFDPAIEMQLKKKKVAVVEGSYELLLWPVGAHLVRSGTELLPANAYSYSKQQFHLTVSSRNDAAKMVTAGAGQTPGIVSSLDRASAGNLATVDFDLAPPGLPVREMDRHPAPNGFSSLLVFRFGAGVLMDVVEPEILSLSAKVSGSRLVLDDPIDATAWGSPMISENGVAGILQDEKSGILFTTAADTLKLPAAAEDKARLAQPPLR